MDEFLIGLVGQIPLATTRAQLTNLFDPQRNTIAYIEEHQFDDLYKFAYISFRTKEAMDITLRLDGHVLNASRITVDKSLPRNYGPPRAHVGYCFQCGSEAHDLGDCPNRGGACNFGYCLNCGSSAHDTAACEPLPPPPPPPPPPPNNLRGRGGGFFPQPPPRSTLPPTSCRWIFPPTSRRSPYHPPPGGFYPHYVTRQLHLLQIIVIR